MSEMMAEPILASKRMTPLHRRRNAYPPSAHPAHDQSQARRVSCSFQNQHIPAGCQLLMDGGDERGACPRLAPILAPTSSSNLTAALLNQVRTGQHHDEGAQDGQDQQAREAEQDEAGLQDRIAV